MTGAYIYLRTRPDAPWLKVPVTVLETRKGAYGRTDHRVTPTGGAGEVWVANSSLHTPESDADDIAVGLDKRHNVPHLVREEGGTDAE